MANKQINARVALKHDIEENWITAGEHDFCPMAGEVIIYDIEEGVCSQLRYKIGRKDSNGQLININDLPFETNLYVGATEPVDAPVGFMWLDTSDEVGDITEELEGTGSEYYTLAPTALTFRSTEPLNEFQEVTINGEVVDSSNYTLEEGSTIVTFPIEFLKTLNTGDYEVSIVSTNKAPKGNFTVKAPELNECGFYYNQPYSEEVPGWGRVTFFIREDGTYDLINGYGVTSSNTYTVDGNSIVALDDNFGAFHCTISSDGKEIYCAEVQTSLKLSNDTSIAADEDYIYIYKEDLGGYEVKAVDKTKASYGDIKTGINGIDTVGLALGAFADAQSIVVAPRIPNTVTTLNANSFINCPLLESVIIPVSVNTIYNDVFSQCNSLQNIIFEGTVAQWNTITFKSDYWHQNTPATHVQCSDGTVAL